MTAKRPWLKFYPADWQSDESLRLCGLAARGLWLEMLALMHKAEPYGHLVINGRPIQPKQLAILAGSSVREVEACLEELREAGVFSFADNGLIYCRRMLRDKALEEEHARNGRKGGNPYVKGGVNPPVNPPVKPPIKRQVNGGDKAHKPEARSQISEEDTTLLCAGARERETPAWQRVVEEVNSPLLDPSRTLAIVTGGIEVDHWVRDGADLRLDIIPTIRAICEQRLRAPVKSWAYFRDAVREATARRMAPPNPIQPAMENTSGPSVVAITPARRPQSPTAIAFALAAEARRREALSTGGSGRDLCDDGLCPPDPDFGG